MCSAIWTLGVALICESCESDQVGLTLGEAMVGFSVGSLIGPPIGGTLYAKVKSSFRTRYHTH